MRLGKCWKRLEEAWGRRVLDASWGVLGRKGLEGPRGNSWECKEGLGKSWGWMGPGGILECEGGGGRESSASFCTLTWRPDGFTKGPVCFSEVAFVACICSPEAIPIHNGKS